MPSKTLAYITGGPFILIFITRNKRNCGMIESLTWSDFGSWVAALSAFGFLNVIRWTSTTTAQSVRLVMAFSKTWCTFRLYWSGQWKKKWKNYCFTCASMDIFYDMIVNSLQYHPFCKSHFANWTFWFWNTLGSPVLHTITEIGKNKFIFFNM